MGSAIRATSHVGKKWLFVDCGTGSCSIAACTQPNIAARHAAFQAVLAFGLLIAPWKSIFGFQFALDVGSVSHQTL